MGLRRHSPADSAQRQRGGGVAGLQLCDCNCRSVLFLGRGGPRLRLSPLHSILSTPVVARKQETGSFPSRPERRCPLGLPLDAAATEKVPPGARVRALSTTPQWNTMEHIAQALVRGRHRKRLLLRPLVMLSGSSALGHVLRSC